MRNTLSRIAAVVFVVLATAGQAQVLTAQPQQVCAERSEPTPGTACGACGTGYRSGTGKQLFTEATPGLQVGADGYWWTCTMPEGPPPPAPPADCPADAAPPFANWKVGDHQCTTARSTITSATDPARVHGMRHGESRAMAQWLGLMRGVVVYQCINGERVQVSASCEPATHCDTGWNETRDGVRYSYDARPVERRVPMGRFAMATAADGAQLRLQCVAGELVARPQCVGPQTKGVRWSTETRVYRYDGEPLEPGALVRMEQTHVVSRDGKVSPGTNRIRWTIGQCMPSGRIQ